MEENIKKILRENEEINRMVDEWEKKSDYSKKYVVGNKWAPDIHICWPEWRIAVALKYAPDVFEQWWKSHGSKCETCIQKKNRASNDLAFEPDNDADTQTTPAAPAFESSDTEYQIITVLFDESWPMEAPLKGAPSLEEETLPYVEYHRIEKSPEEGIDSLWLVTWDNNIFLLIAGSGKAIEKWASGGFMLSKSGSNLGSFVKAGKRETGLLASPGLFKGLQVLCLKTDFLTAKVVLDKFKIPGIFSKEISIVPAGDSKTRLQSIVNDFVMQNNAPFFLSLIPQQTESFAESLTLNFYLRLLLEQDRIDPESKMKLKNYSWVAEDLKQAF